MHRQEKSLRRSLEERQPKKGKENKRMRCPICYYRALVNSKKEHLKNERNNFSLRFLHIHMRNWHTFMMAKSKRFPKNPKKILVLRFDFIGDVLLTTPALHELRKRFPKARIDVVAGSWSTDVLKNNKDINNVIIFDNPFYNRRRKLRGKLKFKELLQFLKFLRNKYDLAISFKEDLATSIFMPFVNAEYKIGYANEKSCRFFDYCIGMPREKHEVERCLDLILSGLDKNKKYDLILNLSRKEREFARKFLKNRVNKGDFVVGIHCGAFWSARCWGNKNFSKLIEALIKRFNAKIILFGTLCDAANIKDITRRLNTSLHKNIIFAYGLSLRQFMALAERCDYYIGNDTGTTHIASAFTKSICLFSMSYYDRIKLWGDNITIHKRVKCSPCYQDINSKYCSIGKERCLALDKIKVNDVLKYIER